MPSKDLKTDIELRRKKHRESFSNYENAVGLICSLEAWVEYRWGPNGKEHPGLLECFNRFPNVDNLTPDFEIRFYTPYIIWGDHKRTIQPVDRDRDDVEQILKYAAYRPVAATSIPIKTVNQDPSPTASVTIKYDVLVLVSSENDNIAAEAINVARKALLDASRLEENDLVQLAPIIVLGCYLDRESIEGEWYKIKWRDHHDNQRFSSPNISPNPVVEDLNKLIVEASHHVIPVNKPAIGRSGRSPFINDTPPPMYTAIRLVIPAINSILSDDERDDLLSTGRVDKTVTKTDLLGVEIIKSMNPQPAGLSKWVEASLEFLATELNCARKVPSTDPQQYKITIDNTLIKSDPRELFSDRAAIKAARQATTGRGLKRFKNENPNQLKLFD